MCYCSLHRYIVASKPVISQVLSATVKNIANSLRDVLSFDGDGTYSACNSCERTLSKHNHTYRGSNDKYGRIHYASDFMAAERDKIEVPREIDRKDWLAKRGKMGFINGM
jgi:hypothetical protein